MNRLKIETFLDLFVKNKYLSNEIYNKYIVRTELDVSLISGIPNDSIYVLDNNKEFFVPFDKKYKEGQMVICDTRYYIHNKNKRMLFRYLSTGNVFIVNNMAKNFIEALENSSSIKAFFNIKKGISRKTNKINLFYGNGLINKYSVKHFYYKQCFYYLSIFFLLGMNLRYQFFYNKKICLYFIKKLVNRYRMLFFCFFKKGNLIEKTRQNLIFLFSKMEKEIKLNELKFFQRKNV